MGVHSGQFGVVNGIPSVRNWTINDNGTLARFVNSATANGHGSKKGVENWNGGYGAHGAVPANFPGSKVTFLGYTAPMDDVSGSTGESYGGTVIVDALGISWNWASGDVLAHQIGFSGDLILTHTTGATAITDAAVSDPEPVGVTKIQTSPDGTTWTSLPNCVSAQLNMMCANQAYVNSDTAGATGRKKGVFDWNASITVDGDSTGNGLIKYNNYYWRFYTTAAYYYDLKWGMVQEFTGLVVEPETDKIIGHTINVSMSGVVGGVKGFVKSPGASPAVIW
jgi:hypothetical protein